MRQNGQMAKDDMIKKGHRWRRNIEVNLNIKINIKKDTNFQKV